MRKSLKTNKVNCKVCNKEFMTLKSVYCSTTCRNIDIKRKKSEEIQGEEGIDYVTCKWCGMKAERLYLSHIKTHHPGKTTDDYRKEFPGAPLSCKKDNNNIAQGYIRYSKSEEGRKKSSEKIKGEKNPNSKANADDLTRKSRSPFSIEYYKKKGIPEDEAKEIISKIATGMCENRVTNTSLEYWINKANGDIEEGERLFKERQHTFSLEKCIKKYGEEKGFEVWKTRQEKWIKNYRKRSYSMISQKLFWDIQSILNLPINEIKFATFYNGEKTENNSEERLFLDNKLILPDFIYKNKIIEFDGVYYHRNTPENKSRELLRDDILLRNGYEVLHVSEKEYKKNPSEVVNKCIKFLNEKNIT